MTNKKEVEKCIEWLERQVEIKTWNMRHSSYSYKHMIERWCNMYISEDSFKEAVKVFKLEYKEMGSHFYIKISEKRLKKPL